MSRLTQVLTQLEALGLVQVTQYEPELAYSFHHSLTWEVAYASILEGDRQEVHRAVGQALEQLYPGRLGSLELAPRLAFHFERASDERSALKYFTLAGEAALGSFANREAEGYFCRALDLVPSGRERVDLLLGLGQARFRQSRFDEALETWGRGIDLCHLPGDSDVLARLYARSARAAWYSDVSKSLRLCQEGLEATAGAPESPGMARLVHEAARAYFFNGQPDEGRPLCQQALGMAERLGIVDVQADALATLGMFSDHAPEEGLEALTRAVMLAESQGLLYQAARAHTNLAYLLYSFVADLRAARDHDRRAAELARQRGSVAGEILSLGNVAHLSLLLGDFEEVEATLSSLRQLQASVDDPGTVAVHILINEAGLLRYRGELEQAADLLRDGQLEARQRGDLEDLCSANVDLANTLVESCVLAIGPGAGREDAGTPAALHLEEAETVLVEAIEVSGRAGWTSVQGRCLLSIVYALQGRTAEADDLLVDIREQTSPGPTQLDAVLLAWATAMVAATEAQWPQTLAAFESAAGIAAALGMRWWWARALQAWAEVHVSRGEPTDLERARALFREARAIFAQLGAAQYAGLVGGRLQALREQTFAWTLDQQKVAQELAIAGRIQAGLLPAEVPHVEGWELVVTLQPARETSGDFYDFIKLPGGYLGFVVADVADKGAGAALYMALSRTLIRTFAGEHGTEPARVLSETNARILADTNVTMFVTVFYGVLDLARGVLTYCNAGHNNPFLVRARGEGAPRALSRRGVALGLLEDFAWEQEAVQFEPGDLLVLYTDGVTEAFNLDKAEFGMERLLAIASANRGHSAREVQRAVLAGLRSFVGDAPRSDDITLMVLARSTEGEEEGLER